MKNIIVTGLDIGNGYLKGRFLGIDNSKINIDIPSCVVGLSTAPDVPDVATDTYIQDIFNKMVCSFKSSIITENRYVMFGSGAISANRSLTEFDIAAANFSKAQQDLSGILVLGAAAGAALRNYWDEHKELPSDVLHIKVVSALALPIDEYKNYRDAFAQKFMSGSHEITIHNFEKNVHISIEFVNVNVLPEGVSAQFAISSKGPDFIQALLDDVRSHDENTLVGITAEDISGCMNTCGIDIGEGTVNLPVITDGNFNQVASTTLQKGYGTVLEQSIPRVLGANMPYSTRKALAAFLESNDNPFNRSKKRTCRDIINAEATDLVNDIVRQVSHVLSSGMVEVIYVYGGGATPMKEALYNTLIQKTSLYSGGDAFPILYLDSSYARNLNREGLFNVAVADAQSMKLI